MKKLLLIMLCAIGTFAQAQEITGKKGNTYDVRDYETITVFTSTHKFVFPRITFDGYDEVKIGKKSVIKDGKRITKGRDVKRLAYKEAFWITYLKRNGFKLDSKNEVEVRVSGGSITPGTMTLTFVKQ